MKGLLTSCILSYGEEYNYSSVQTHTGTLHNRLGIRLHACASSVSLENTNQALCFSCLSVNWIFSLSFKQLDDRAVDVVMTKLFNNYRKWCKFLSRKHSLRCNIPYNCYQRKNHSYCKWYWWSSDCRFPQGAQPQEIQQRKILYLGLYLLIWGEAANIRFMPECLCYIFHNVWYTFLIITFCGKARCNKVYTLWHAIFDLLRWHMSCMVC